MAKGKARFSAQQLDLMGLMPDNNGGWKPKGIISERSKDNDNDVDMFLDSEVYEDEKERFKEQLSDYWKYKSRKVYVGIDPGKSGAISFVNPEGLLEKWGIPIAGKDIDANELYRILKDISERYSPVVILEDVHSLFGMSAASNFSFGFVCGMIRAMVIANTIPFHMVAPKTWQKLIWVNDDKVYKPKKPTQKNPSVDTKATSLKAATRIFPHFDLTKNERSKVPHDGIVDAVLLSEYGRRLNL